MFLPPKRYITWPFITKVMSGEKLLLPQSAVRINIIPPKIRDLTIRRIWNDLRGDEELFRYFPDGCMDSEPPRSYFFSILSAVRPGVFQELLQTAEGRYLQKQESTGKMFTIADHILEQLDGVNIKYSLLSRKSDKRIYLGPTDD